MKQTTGKKILSLLLVVMLCAAMALTGCSDKSSLAPTPSEGSVVGEGSTVFPFTVVDGEGNQKAYEVRTDKTTVGAALLDVGLIEGEEGPYGLYVKTVDGITLDYDTDGKYWAFYVDGAYAVNGVDATDIEAGASYAFKAE